MPKCKTCNDTREIPWIYTLQPCPDCVRPTAPKKSQPADNGKKCGHCEDGEIQTPYGSQRCPHCAPTIPPPRHRPRGRAGKP